jgi:hypothetical protein
MNDVFEADLARLIAACPPSDPPPTAAPKAHTSDYEDEIGADELCSLTFAPLDLIAPPFIAVGVTIIAGNPKVGKSWLCLNLGDATATGGAFLGGDPCSVGDVLYLALEDNRRRLQRRMTKLYGLSKERWPARLRIVTKSKLAHQDGLDQIRQWAARSKRPRLVMIDTYGRFRKPRHPKEDAYQADYASVTELQQLAHELGIAIVLIHHNRKSGAEVDPFEVVSGTAGLTAGADTVFVIRREAQTATTLYGRGRDIEEDIEIGIKFDPETAIWQNLGPADLVRASEERRAILAVLDQSDVALAPKDIAAALKKPGGTVRPMLALMVADGLIRKVGSGYTLMLKVVVEEAPLRERHNTTHTHTTTNSPNDPNTYRMAKG